MERFLKYPHLLSCVIWCFKLGNPLKLLKVACNSLDLPIFSILLQIAL